MKHTDHAFTEAVSFGASRRCLKCSQSHLPCHMTNSENIYIDMENTIYVP